MRSEARATLQNRCSVQDCRSTPRVGLPVQRCCPGRWCAGIWCTGPSRANRHGTPNDEIHMHAGRAFTSTPVGVHSSTFPSESPSHQHIRPSASLSTVNSLLTHTPWWPLKPMSYGRVWYLREVIKPYKSSWWIENMGYV